MLRLRARALRRDFRPAQSEKGAKAWASLQVEELRRTAVAVIDAESNGSAVASSKLTASSANPNP